MEIFPNNTNTPPSYPASFPYPLPSLPVSFFTIAGKSGKRGDNDPFDTKIFGGNFGKKGMNDENIYENIPLLYARMNISSFKTMSD
jgi:hypothetical protein